MVGGKEFIRHLVAIKAEVVFPPPCCTIWAAARHVLDLFGSYAQPSQSRLLLRFVGVIHDYLVIVPGFIVRYDELRWSSLYSCLTGKQLGANEVQQSHGTSQPHLERNGLAR